MEGTKQTIGDEALDHLALRETIPASPKSTLSSYGTLSCGYETMSQAWPTLRHRFSVGAAESSQAEHTFREARYKMNLLKEYPVDLLVVDQGSSQPSWTQNKSGSGRWEQLVDQTPPERHPWVVLESWPGSAVGWEVSPMHKSVMTRWAKRGFSSRYKLINSLHCGGAIRQTRLMIARVRDTYPHNWEWPSLDTQSEARPMGNLLTPWGLLPRQVKRCTKPPNTTYSRPNSLLNPMPTAVGAWIDTPEGTRRLQADEVGRGLGIPKEQVSGPSPVNPKLLAHTTSVFVWESISETLASAPASSSSTPPVGIQWDDLKERAFVRERREQESKPDTTFSWTPPDLSPGGDWHAVRIANLKKAAATYGHQEQEIYEDGLTRLAVHRQNYTETGAAVKQLQLLWWEFPPEHWEDLRVGCRMNFLTEPPHCLHPNSEMDEEQIEVAAQFVDELIDITAVRLPPPGMTVLATTPLFCIPKAGQPGEWRVIANAKEGGQNDHMGNDPVYLNRPLHILEQMYDGGFTAVVDASKFFYQFPVHPEDQAYLGLLHPKTQVMYVWCGCPMGSGSSPALACRFGLSFVRMLKEKAEVYAKRGSANCWWTHVTTGGYDPKKGYGLIFTCADGSPAVKIWVHVDDFAIHGPTLRATHTGLKLFLDLAVDVGLLCHPKKLKAPSQVQLYTGFIFDTRRNPCLRIPLDKRDRAVAMVDYVINYPSPSRLSRLALSVIAGTLESLAEATPNRLGHTYLRQTHSLLHPEGYPAGRKVYYTTCTITAPVLAEMQWWRCILLSGKGRTIRSSKSASLVTTWGDGSGTGTGGTISVAGSPFKLWMGKWSPTVYRHSSNWKELKTLLLTLQQLAANHSKDLQDTTVFYFTDNSTTYWVTRAGASKSPNLHALVEQILLLAADVGCKMEVIHVPGLLMIDQGTDGLSRGIWTSPLHRPVDQEKLTASIFSPVPVDMDLAYRIQLDFSLPGTLRYHHWSKPWGKHLFDHLSVWFPPPEIAHQCLIGILEAWVERPLTTSALIFVPRTMVGNWSSLSKHLQELTVLDPRSTPFSHPPELPIPIIVLYLPSHTRSLPSSSPLDPSPVPNRYRWHQRAAEAVRGLS